MRANRTVLIIVAILLIAVSVCGFLYWNTTRAVQDAIETLPEIMPTPAEYIEIVVSAQNPIPKGWRFQPNDGAATLQAWPIELLPPLGYLTSLDQINNMYASNDISKGTPIVSTMLSEAPVAQFPPGRIAYTIPMDIQGGVSWRLQPGDHVDVLAAIRLASVDTEFQSQLPNQFLMFVRTEEDATQLLSGTYGRFETLPNGEPGLVFPAAPPIPNVVVQLTVQNAIVWHVGIWQSQETQSVTAPASSGPTGPVLGDPGAAPAPTAAPAPAATGMRGDVEPVTLLVSHQDALVIKYLLEIGADIDLAVRALGDESLALTEPVWLRYILDRYQIPAVSSDLPVAPLQQRVPLILTPIATPAPVEE